MALSALVGVGGTWHAAGAPATPLRQRSGEVEASAGSGVVDESSSSAQSSGTARSAHATVGVRERMAGASGRGVGQAKAGDWTFPRRAHSRRSGVLRAEASECTEEQWHTGEVGTTRVRRERRGNAAVVASGGRWTSLAGASLTCRSRRRPSDDDRQTPRETGKGRQTGRQRETTTETIQSSMRWSAAGILMLLNAGKSTEKSRRLRIF